MKKVSLHELQLIRIYLFNDWINSECCKTKGKYLSSLDKYLGDLIYVTCW